MLSIILFNLGIAISSVKIVTYIFKVLKWFYLWKTLSKQNVDVAVAIKIVDITVSVILIK